MNIRLYGPVDLICAWAQALKASYGAYGHESLPRRNDEPSSVDVCALHIEIDDREAERIVAWVGVAPLRKASRRGSGRKGRTS